MAGKTVSLEFDVQERDKYGRVLAYAWVGNTFVNAYLVEAGLARVATFPPNVKYVELFTRLQKEAREAGRGMWGTPLKSEEVQGLTVRASVSNPAPRQNSTVYVNVAVIDEQGNPAAGAQVTATAHYKTTNTSHQAVTDASGKGKYSVSDRESHEGVSGVGRHDS